MSKLGKLGLELEEMRLGIEFKYEEIIKRIKTSLQEIKKHFNHMIQNIENDCFSTISIEKTQNLSNLKTLEDKLSITIGKEKKMIEEGRTEFGTSLLAFEKFFTFVSEFKEECFGLILSKPIPPNPNIWKKEINEFNGRFLNGLLRNPKAFPSELFRFFESNANEDFEIEDVEKFYGDCITMSSSLPETIELFKTDVKLKPQIPNYKKTPIIEIIDNQNLIVLTRDNFKVHKYVNMNEGDNPTKIKSKFYTPSSDSNNSNLHFLDQLTLKDTNFFKDFPEIVIDSSNTKNKLTFHCVKYVSTTDGKEFILIGGNQCVLIFY